MPDPIPISSSDRVFVLTGAGVSAESGIPTFRGAGGLWRNYRIEEVASPIAWARDPRLVWEFYSMRRRVAASAKPNAGHEALADLQRRLAGRFTLCTQNVDSLHEQAGSTDVVHMHGELFKSRCDRSLDPGTGAHRGCSRDAFDDAAIYEDGELPRCACGGIIRPHICWFGEIPYHMDRIRAELQRCTVFLAIGTSGVVQPAAGFAGLARSNRARTYYIGPDAPANSPLFDAVLPINASEAGKWIVT
jgi:NAD-dependent deacetylase